MDAAFDVDVVADDTDACSVYLILGTLVGHSSSHLANKSRINWALGDLMAVKIVKAA